MAVQAQQMFNNPESGSAVGDHLQPMCGLLQDWVVVQNPVVSSGLDSDFYFNSQDQIFPGQNLFFNHYNRAPTASHCSNSSTTTYDHTSLPPMSTFSQSLHAHLELQRQEADCIIQIQNERLRYVLQEQRKHQVATLIRCVETKALPLMRQKEEHLALARKQNMELAAKLLNAQFESESWQKISLENEAVMLDLSNTLEQVRERVALVNNSCQDEESFCCGGSNSSDTKDHEEDDGNKDKNRMDCRSCNSRRACVLLLPCRHVCSCKSCDPFLDSCPVCNSVKESSLEVFWGFESCRES